MSQSSSLPAPVEKPFLLGPPRKMPNDRLPTKLDVLLHFNFIFQSNHSTRDVAEIVAEEIMLIWEKSFVITSIFAPRKNIIKNILYLYSPRGTTKRKFCYTNQNKKFANNLKKYPIEVCRKGQELYLKSLNQLFDIARCKTNNANCTCQYCSVLLSADKRFLCNSRKGRFAKISAKIDLRGTARLLARENINISTASTSRANRKEPDIEFSQESNESSSSDFSVASNDDYFHAEKNQSILDISNVLSFAIRKKIPNKLLVELLNAFLLDLKENNVTGISDIPYFTIAQVQEQRKIHQNQNFFD